MVPYSYLNAEKKFKLSLKTVGEYMYETRDYEGGQLQNRNRTKNVIINVKDH